MVLAVLVPIMLLSVVTTARMASALSRPTLLSPGAVEDLTPAELTAVAATELDVAVATGGRGYTFEIVQRSTLVARTEGPPLEIADPTDPELTISVPSLTLGTYLERGSVTPAGFHSEIRRGPEDPATPIDWAASPPELAALVRDGKTYRNDGAGWYLTANPPGIGLDPATAAQLPTLLRELTQAIDKANDPIDPQASPEPGLTAADPFAGLDPARRLEGATKVADLPGIIAVDLAEATELRGPAELAFDDAGRLIGLRVLARNTHLDAQDLLVETVITLAYPDAPPPLPLAEPTWVPSTPAPDSGE